MLSDQMKASIRRVAEQEPAFEAYLRTELDRTHEVLVNNVDEVQLRHAQGRAQQLTSLIKLLAHARAERR